MTASTELVPIGTFARAARLTVKALRHYQRTGLLAPQHTDPSTGYRYYTWAQLYVAVRIATLRQLGVPVNDIRDHLAGRLPLSQLAAQQRERRLDEITVASQALAAWDALFHGVDPGPYTVAEVVHPERTTWTMTSDVDAARLDGAAVALIDRLLEAASRCGIDTTPSVWGEYPVDLAGTITFTVHLPIPDGAPPALLTDIARPGYLPAGTYATTVHRGPLATLPFAYRSLLAHLAEHRRPAIGPVYERYLTDPGGPSQHPTEIEVLHPVHAKDPPTDP